MPSAFRDPKALPQWIELDYHRRRRGLWRWRWRLTWGTLAACAVAVGASAFSRRAQSFYQAGPVAPAHALFACAECHTTPLQTARRFLPWNAAVPAVPNDACVKCHDGPAHNGKQFDADKEKACAACHHEHRGRAALARVPDRDCTACHRDVKAHTTDPAGCLLENVTGFPADHPDFRLWRGPKEGTPRLHFSHHAHLNPDWPRVEGWERRFGKKWRQLECDDCHRTDPAGRLMRPVRYEDQCKKCHPLSVQLTGEMKDPGLERAAKAFAAAMQGPGLERAAREFAADAAPHQRPEEVRAVLRDRLLALVRQYAPTPGKPAEGPPDRLGPHPPSPGRQTWVPSPQERDEATRLAFVVEQMPHVETLMFRRVGGCALCHVEEGRGPDGLPRYAATGGDRRWLPAARFGHESHRLLACTECHAAAPASGRLGRDLMPHVQLCADCHDRRAGARSDCVECHGYHDYGKDGYKAHKELKIDQALGR